MKICIVSDSHDRGPMLAAAVEEARSLGAEAVLHCGDIIGPNTLKPLLKIGLPMHVIHGNNLGDFTAICQMAARSEGLLHYHGGDASIDYGKVYEIMVVLQQAGVPRVGLMSQPAGEKAKAR